VVLPDETRNRSTPPVRYIDLATHRATVATHRDLATPGEARRDPYRSASAPSGARTLPHDHSVTRKEATVTTVEYTSDVREDIRAFGKAWWLFLITGVLWIFVSLLVLQFNLTSVTAIAVLMAVVLLMAAVEELFSAFTMAGWKWLHGLLGVLFLFGGIWAFAYPAQTFGTLALLIGWFLLFKGTFDIVVSLMNKDMHLWWFGLIAGIAEVIIAFWAVSYPGRSAVLLVLWVGFAALFRGIGQIILAFQIRQLGKAVA
jgi:uncharacterized membrane protein HdeD (DUF308 family)